MYQSCYDLPLSRFIRIMCERDYSALIKEQGGELPADEILQERWNSIYQQYLDLSGAGEENHILVLTMEVNQLFFRYTAITESVALMRKGYRYDELVTILKQAGYNFQFNHNDPSSFYKDLDRVTTRVKALLVQLEQKKIQLEALEKKDSENTQDKRAAFDQWLVTLSKWSHYHIDEDQTTVSRFVTIRNNYIAHYEQLKAQQHGR